MGDERSHLHDAQHENVQGDWQLPAVHSLETSAFAYFWTTVVLSTRISTLSIRYSQSQAIGLPRTFHVPGAARRIA
ncbi:hypothetical protein ACN47E_009404 [Coniothyrium glycines]